MGLMLVRTFEVGSIEEVECDMISIATCQRCPPSTMSDVTWYLIPS